MSIAGFPTSSDIYLEVDGTKVAVVQSYSSKASKTSRAVEAFGEEEPVATVPGQTTHVLELTRLYATDEAIRDGIDFYSLSDFSLVICKPDRRSSTPTASGAAFRRRALWGIWCWRK